MDFFWGGENLVELLLCSASAKLAFPSVSDYVLRTELGSLTYTDRHAMSIVRNQPDRPDLRRTDWSKFQACLEAGLPSNPDLPIEVVIYACVKELPSSVSKALAESTPKCRPRDDPRPPISARIQDEIASKTG